MAKGAKQLLNHLAIRLGPWLIRLLRRSYRYRILPPDHSAANDSKRIYVFWHGKMIPLLALHIGQKVAVMISEHNDGEIIAQVIARLGLTSIRGSSTRGGRRAFVNMLTHLRGGQPAAITPDGPKGPRHSVKPGVIQLSAAAGAPLLLINWYAQSKWQLRSWDRFELAKPFAKVTIAYSELPAFSANSDLNEAQAQIQQQMQQLEDRCRQAHGR
jgi:lysophospholipid acyltransferase (LPLAT)-like uncharacterized protein